MVPQFNNSEDFAIASEKRNKSIQNKHLGLSQREYFWVCVTTRNRGSLCLQARLYPAFGSEICLLAPAPPLSLASLPPLQLPKCRWLDGITKAGGKQCSDWPGWGTWPILESEVKSLYLNHNGWEKRKEVISQGDRRIPDIREWNGHWVIKLIDVLDGGIHFSSNSKSISNFFSF